jgi:ankyrin repeat protein
MATLFSGCVHPGSAKKMILASDSDDAAEIERLLGSGVNANGSAFDGWSAVTSAAWRGKNRSLRALLNHGVDPNFVDMNGNNPLFYAGLGCHEDTWDLLRSYNADALGSNQKMDYLLREAKRVCPEPLVEKIVNFIGN